MVSACYGRDTAEVQLRSVLRTNHGRASMRSKCFLCEPTDPDDQLEISREAM